MAHAACRALHGRRKLATQNDHRCVWLRIWGGIPQGIPPVDWHVAKPVSGTHRTV